MRRRDFLATLAAPAILNLRTAAAQPPASRIEDHVKEHAIHLR